MSVPLRFPTMIPIGPWCLTTTKSTVNPTVMAMFARVAIENATDRFSARKRFVICA